jgi:DNA-binding transcriptional MerR regulator
VATIAGVKPSVLRFWETQFAWLKPQKSRTNQRVYTRKQVERVLEIKDLLKAEKLTIAGARRRLARGAGKGGGREVSSLLETLKKEVRELLRLLDE